MAGWAAPSCDIVNKLAEVHHWKMKGRIRLLAPDQSLAMPPNTAVLTIGAGTDRAMRNSAVLAGWARTCVHAEPICEWYDEATLRTAWPLNFTGAAVLGRLPQRPAGGCRRRGRDSEDETGLFRQSNIGDTATHLRPK